MFKNKWSKFSNFLIMLTWNEMKKEEDPTFGNLPRMVAVKKLWSKCQPGQDYEEPMRAGIKRMMQCGLGRTVAFHPKKAAHYSGLIYVHSEESCCTWQTVWWVQPDSIHWTSWYPNPESSTCLQLWTALSLIHWQSLSWGAWPKEYLSVKTSVSTAECICLIL